MVANATGRGNSNFDSEGNDRASGRRQRNRVGAIREAIKAVVSRSVRGGAQSGRSTESERRTSCARACNDAAQRIRRWRIDAGEL